jgi:uncharacterized protein (TIGR02270 family)
MAKGGPEASAVSARRHGSVAAVVAQHVEDAASLRSTRAVLVRAPHVELLHLARLDERLIAHLDGVVIAADDGFRTALDALQSPGVGQTFVVAVTALMRRDFDQLDRLLSLIGAAPDAGRAVVSAFGWVSPQRLRGMTPDLLGSPEPARRWLGLSACALHWVDPGEALSRAIADANPLLRARSLRAAGELGRTDLLDPCLSLLDETYADCRFQAARSALLLGGGRRAEQSLDAMAMRSGPFAREALQLLLLRADPDRARALVRQLSGMEGATRLTIEATGWAGDVQAVPWLIEQMSDERHARVAGEAFTLLTGADLALLDLEGETPEKAEGGPTEEAQDDNVELDADESLPWPDTGRVRSWWNENAARMPVGTRCFMGAAADEGHCLHVLRTGGQRQRAIAALLLALARPGSVLFNIAAPAPRQQRLLGLPQRVM